MGNGKAAVYGVVLVMALLIAVMVQAQSEPPGPPPGVGNDTNAATLCDPGELLAGDSSCIQFPARTAFVMTERQRRGCPGLT